MVMAVIERGVEPVEISIGGKRHRVLEQAEVEVGFSVNLQLSGILAEQPGFSSNVIMKRFPLRLEQLSAYAKVVFVV